MSISIRKIGYEHNLLETSDSIINEVLNYMHKNKLQDKYPLLRGVDYYDHTYFNHRQSSDLAAELEKLKSEPNVTPSLSEQINKIVKFISRVGDLQYVHFVGD